jgi:methylisocitrate lyase
VFHLVRAFEDAGAAGVMIEDQECRSAAATAGKSAIDADEMVKKVYGSRPAAIQNSSSRRAPMRSRPTGRGHRVAARRYAEAGADLPLADAIASEDDIRAIVKAVAVPLCVNMVAASGTTPLMSSAALGSA